MFVIALLAIVAAGFCLARSPSGTYAPSYVNCPQSSLLRRAQGTISDRERDYISKRQIITDNALESLLIRLDIPGLDVASLKLTSNATSKVTIGLSFSGGGYRALLTGAGVLAALDSRLEKNPYLEEVTPTSHEPRDYTVDRYSAEETDRLRDQEEGFWNEGLEGWLEPNQEPESVHPLAQSMYRDKIPHEVHDHRVQKSPLEGLLQSTSYISGLSGGSWLIGSMILNDMKPVPALTSSSLWNFEVNLALGEVHSRVRADRSASGDSALPFDFDMILKYYENLHGEVSLKKAAGFPISLTDYWARALSRRLIDSGGDQGVTWSDITQVPSFQSHEAPFPIALAVTLEPGREFDSSTSTIIEFTPYEFGSWDPGLDAFVDMRYLGSHIDNGTSLACVEGFDNAGFVMGTSSSLFNALVLNYMKKASATKRKAIVGLRDTLAQVGLDSDLKSSSISYREYALYYNNPFLNFSPAESPYTRMDTLLLGDGGQDGQNLPLEPLFIPDRKVDVVFAIDSTSDINNYPNGSAIHRPTIRYGHGQYGIFGEIHYPKVPPEAEIVRRNPANRPMFFGCRTNPRGPLLVYIPNSYFTYPSNTPTLRLSYTKTECLHMMNNGYNVMTQKGSGVWAKCVGCATIYKHMQRTNVAFPEFCKSCFKRYCYN